MTAITVNAVSFGYEKQNKVLDNLSFEIKKGSVVAIKGASGCGKSTLALILCGVIPKSVQGYMTGEVWVCDKNIADIPLYQSACDISMVFQDPETQLFSSMVIDEIAFAPENLCYEQDLILKIVNDCANSVGIDSLLHFSPNHLSGGQKQLIALASILSLDPNIIILDEVTAGIDKQGVVLIKKAVLSLISKGKTIIIIDHKGDLKDLYDTKIELCQGRIKENCHE